MAGLPPLETTQPVWRFAECWIPARCLLLKDIIHVTQLAPSHRSQKTHFQKALERTVIRNRESLQVRGWKSRSIPSKVQAVSYSVIKGRRLCVCLCG